MPRDPSRAPRRSYNDLSRIVRVGGRGHLYQLLTGGRTSDGSAKYFPPLGLPLL